MPHRILDAVHYIEDLIGVGQYDVSLEYILLWMIGKS